MHMWQFIFKDIQWVFFNGETHIILEELKVNL